MRDLRGRPGEGSWRAALIGGAGVALVSALLLVATAGDYGLTWDEPVYINLADRLESWFSELVQGVPEGRAALFGDVRLRESWPFGRREDRNLPFPVLVSALGHAVGGSWLEPLRSYRLGHCLLAGAALGALFALLVPWGWEPAALACGGLLLMPQFFAHAHIAATDAPTSCLWVLALACWLRSEARPALALLTACLCGLGLATKASFALLPALLFAWMLAFRQWSWWRSALVVLVVSPLVMLALCPMWWADPLGRVVSYFVRGVGQAQRFWRIDAYYLGRTYVGHVPWPSAFILPLVSMPPWTLGLALAGAVAGFRRRDAAVGLWTIGAVALPALRLLPGTPGHDGIRLLLPSLACLAPLAGYGLAPLAGWLRAGERARRLALAGLLAWGTAEVAWAHPYEMSYYSECIGGLSGAARLGFEVTYWYDAYTPEAVHEIQLRLPPHARVATYPNYGGYDLLRRWGLWREDLEGAALDDAGYLIVYMRKATFEAAPEVRRIVAEQRPIWSLRSQGVDLVALYRLR